jgi:arginyl-tRNA synthetase
VAAKLAADTGIAGKETLSELLEIPPEERLGDYALPCFPFAKELKRAPNLVAKELAAKVVPDAVIAKAEAAGSYLNLFLNRETVIRSAVTQILKEKERYGAGGHKKERVMIEYSQPNTHKAFHVGHLRGTSIGEALARILRHAGFDVVQANYSGDTGMHVAKWLWCYTRFHKGEGPPKGEKGAWLASIYVEAVKRLDEKPELQADVDRVNLALDEGKEKELLRLWKETRQWSIEEFKRIYKELDARFDVWWFEREMEARAKAVSRELVKKGIAEVSDDAVIVNLEKEGLGVWVLLRKDGTPLYSAKDLALAEKKFTEYRIGRSVYVIGRAQALHMQQLFRTLELMRFEQAKRCFHLDYEEVRLPEGKISSRTGQNILYTDVRDEVFAYTEKEVRSRHDDWSDEKIQGVVKAVAVCALKFEMVYRDHNRPIVYDVAKVCDFEGDTGPYVQYTHARCNSILAKLGKKPTVQGAAFRALTTDHEYRLAKELLRFPAAVEEIASHLYPSSLAKYGLELSKALNMFYHECRVIGEQPEVENGRALLVEATRIVLEQSLTLLGIEAPKQM